MPSISQPFEISSAFSTPRKESRVVVTGTQSEIFVAIPRNSIASYIVAPSPHIRWNKPVSPATDLTCIDRNILKGSEVIAYGVVERKKSQLKVSGTKEEQEDQLEKSYPFKNEIRFVKILDDGTCICVLQDSSIETVTIDDEESKSWSLKSKSNRVFVYASCINSGIDSAKASLLVVSRKQGGKKTSYEVRIIAIENTRGVELFSKDIIGGGSAEFETEHYDSMSFAVQGTYLYRFVPENSQIEVYDLNTMGKNIIEIAALTIKKEASDSSLISLGTSLLLQYDKRLFLIDPKHKTLLAECDVEHHLILMDSFKTRSGYIAVGQMHLTKTDCTIVELSIEPGKGTLLESFSKGIQSNDKVGQWKYGLSDIMIISKTTSLKEYNQELEARIQNSINEVHSLLAKLKDSRTLKDIDIFEKHIFDYIKGESKYSLNSGNSLIYDINYDRQLDKDLIIDMLSLIYKDFSLRSRTDKKLDLKEVPTLDPTFIPENVIIYLLTHPLFPTPQFPNLLDSFQNHPRLYRQAIVTAQGISLHELIDSLKHADDEIFKDAVSRLAEEFGTEQITKIVRIKYSTMDRGDFVDTVKRLVRLDVGWTIISSFIDAGGLFLWDEPLLEVISKRVDNRVDTLESTMEIISVIDEFIHKIDPSCDTTRVKKTSKKELKKISKKNITSETPTSSHLWFGASSTPIDSVKVPIYTVEKLEF